MFKFPILSHGVSSVLLACLLLGTALAQAAPGSSDRLGLPDDARPVWIGDQRYYVSRDSWFMASGSDGRHTPTPAPREVQMAGADMFDVIAYPMNGQDFLQEQQDRGQCHRWAIDQSGFDATHALEPPTRLQAGTYHRALAACLAGHHYSVQ